MAQSNFQAWNTQSLTRCRSGAVTGMTRLTMIVREFEVNDLDEMIDAINVIKYNKSEKVDYEAMLKVKKEEITKKEFILNKLDKDLNILKELAKTNKELTRLNEEIIKIKKVESIIKTQLNLP